jgi:glucose-6-phosphate 1-dehydrogenase
MADDTRPLSSKQSSGTLKPADPCAMVLLGATGDLSKRLVIPALYNLERTRVLPDGFALIGAARSQDDADGWRRLLRKNLEELVKSKTGTFNADKIEEDAWDRLSARMMFVQGDLTRPDLYQAIGEALEKAASDRPTNGNALFYLAVSDRLFGPVVDQLGVTGLMDETHGAWRRVVIEKPFGHDLPSAQALNAQIRRMLREEQVFRIDHFLGKDTVRNIMAVRFANGLFEPLWNRDRIDHVQVTAAETVGVEERGEFYEQTGALRDMVPNHVLSLVTLMAMEPPISLAAEEVRAKKVDVLAAIAPVSPKKAVRGQYGADEDGKVLGYRQEPDVARDSTVETYAALELEIDNWRWAGVPFFLRTGKHLAARVTEIAIRFKCAPQGLFRDLAIEPLRPNWLVLRVAPDENISLQFEVKRRGPELQLAPVKMEFHYNDWFEKEPNVGYESLLYDVMIGDQTSFMRADMVEHGWRILQPVLDSWAAAIPDFPNYRSGSEGPEAADALIASASGRTWRPVSRPERAPS